MNIPKDATILFQGDSITDCGRARNDQDNPNNQYALGTGYANFAAASLLADHPDKSLKCFNRGISGNRIVDLYARWKEDCLNLNPALISILIGVNDTWHHHMRNAGVDVPKFTRVYRQLLEETVAALPGVRLVICEPFVLPCGVVQPAWVEEMALRRAAVRQLAADFKATFIPFQAMFDDAQKRAPAACWAGDGVHPTPAGHMLMTRTWLERVFG